MRLVGSVAGEREANAFADYLLAKKIPAKVLTARDGRREIWVQHEDQVVEAAEEFRAFVESPDDPRYRASRGAARDVRRASEKAEKQHRKNTRDLRERWEGPGWRTCPLTSALVVASVVVALLTNFGRDRFAGFDPDSLNRPTLMRLLSFSDYTAGIDLFPTMHLRLDGHGFSDIFRGQVWRLVTPIFLHFSVWHLLFNMGALRYFGGLIERDRGTRKLLILVLVSAVAANVGECLIELQSRDVVLFGGMSGVCYALFGYLWMKGWAHPEEGLGVGDNTVLMMMIWFVIGFVRVIDLPIANAEHGVGLVVGMSFGLSRF